MICVFISRLLGIKAFLPTIILWCFDYFYRFLFYVNPDEQSLLYRYRGSSAMNTAYSIIMAVYKKDQPEWLKQSIDSLLNQTVVSDDIIIIVDGPLTAQLDGVLSRYDNNKSITLIKLQANQGLGNALNVGIKKAKHQLIARMDSDDISIPNRFELQIAEFNKNPKLDILGGQVAEFIDNPEEIVAYRKVPTGHLEIKKFACRRNPFNHPTVMYKKTTIQKLGCYNATALRIEDYDLWLRAISSGAMCANLDVVLLKYRSTIDAMKRRKTLTSIKSHIKVRFRFLTKKYISFSDFIYGVTTQVVLFLMPVKFANLIFNMVVRK